MIVIVVRMSATMGMIGAAHRLEAFRDLRDGGAEAGQHVPDHVVPEDEDALLLSAPADAGTEMPGQFDQVQPVARPDFEKPPQWRTSMALPSSINNSRHGQKHRL
jgi:hypothetical protein